MGTLSAPCPHCLHDKSLHEAVWDRALNRAATEYQSYMLCSHCGFGVGFFIRSKHGAAITGPVKISGDLDPHYYVVDSWPSPKQLAAPEHVPPSVSKRFIEGEDAFHRRNWNSAVAMYRSALDIATKAIDGVPAGLTFFKRLEWMFEHGRITRDIREWADQVRVDGNAALHEPEEFSEVDATSLRYFTEMFLRYVFELPGRVAEFRERGGAAVE